MQIAIHAVNLALTTQIRAYVEYRMFSATSRFGPAGPLLRIMLDEREVIRAGGRYRCSAVLDLTPVGQIRVSAASDRLYAAIDEAAERLSRAGDHHLVTKGRDSRSPSMAGGATNTAGLTAAARRYAELAQAQG
jgi:ribosomal subunit interface protein